MKATMKQIVAANRVGIISTPNQPTYRRLLVEVTQEQKFSQEDCDCCLERVEADIEKGLCKSAGNTSKNIPDLPSRSGMRDVVYTP